VRGDRTFSYHFAITATSKPDAGAAKTARLPTAVFDRSSLPGKGARSPRRVREAILPSPKEERVPRPERQVLVCVNTRPPGNPKGSCGEKGSPSLFEALRDLVRERGLADRVMVNRAYCLKHCSRGPTLAVQPDNVWYAAVERRDLDEIVSSHLERGRPVERLFMPDIPWE
jgi:(2Fe-2S) ferredoxin